MFKSKTLSTLLIILGLLLLAACNSSEPSESIQGESGKDDGSSSEESESQLPEGYPDQTINVIVGYGAGGGTDLSARNMVEALNSAGIVEQSFVVENMPGAGGALAMKEIANDGDDYMLEAVPEYGSGLWNDNAGDLELSDFTPIAQVATDYQLICVREDSPYETIENLLDAMKEDPQSVVISLASSLDGGEPWRWNQVADEYGIDKDNMKLVSLEGGNAALTALLGGDANATFVVPQLAADHIEKGNIRCLASMTDDRTDQFPNIPTLKEKDVNVTYYRTRGFWMNGNVSEEVADYWENAFKEMMDTEVWKKYVEDSGLLLEFKGRDEYTNYIAEDGAAYKEYYDTFRNQ